MKIEQRGILKMGAIMVGTVPSTKLTDQTHIRLGFTMLFSCVLAGGLLGAIGLLGHEQSITILSAVTFAFGILSFLVCLVYPFKMDGFWFSCVLERLGRVGLLRRFQIGVHAEGAVTLTLTLMVWNIYQQTIVGAGSYILNDFATMTYILFADSWIFIAMHRHFRNTQELCSLSRLVRNREKPSFEAKIRRITRQFNRLSLLLFAIGFITFNLVATFWVDPQDRLLERCTFYVTTTAQSATFGIAYPPTILNYYYGKVSTGIIYGLFAVVGGLVVMTTMILLWLTSDEMHIAVDIYDPLCLKPAERLLNSFWLLTGAGLSLVPYVVAVSSNSRTAGFSAASRWLNYLSWSYVIFFAGLFIFSLARFYTLVSAAKTPVEKEIREEIEDALRMKKIDRRKLDAAKLKMRLLSEFKSRPTLATAFQLLQILGIILLNALVKFLE